jgi:hypothetical protein
MRFDVASGVAAAGGGGGAGASAVDGAFVSSPSQRACAAIGFFVVLSCSFVRPRRRPTALFGWRPTPTSWRLAAVDDWEAAGRAKFLPQN